VEFFEPPAVVNYNLSSNKIHKQVKK